jgi:hypothetical protein
VEKEMELIESIEHINNLLLAEFGREPLADDKVRFRIVWSDDQFEKRWIAHTDDGFELLYPEVRELPKYRQYIQHRYILERLVPVGVMTDLVEKTSYEPMYTFQSSDGEYLVPRFDVCKFIIESVLSITGRRSGHAKYKDVSLSPEYRRKAINEMEKYLFGNETSIGDALAYSFGVTVPDLKNPGGNSDG